MTGIITGPHLFEMDELVNLANEDRIMIGDASEINLKKKYKFTTYANLKSQLELDPSTSPTNVAQEDTVTFVSATDTVTLPSTPISNSVDVHVDGVIQYEGVHYNIVGNDIVFDEVLPIDTVVRYKYWESLGPGAAIQDLQNVTDQGSTTTKKITAQDFEFRTTAGRLLYPGGTNTMLGQVGGGFFLAAGGNTIINSNVANDGAVISKLQVSGAVTFSNHTANPGETLPTVVDENGLLSTVPRYSLDSVSSVDPVTSNALTVGSIKWNNANGRILSSLNTALFEEGAGGSFILSHNGIDSLASESDGLKLLSSRALYFEGNTVDTVMTMEWGSGGQFDLKDHHNRRITIQSDGDMEFWTGSALDDPNPIAKHFEIGSNGSIILNAGTDGTLTHALFETATGIVKKRPITDWTTLALSGSLTGNVEYYKDPLGFVHFRGQFGYLNAQSEVSILPAAIVPENNLSSFLVFHENPSTVEGTSFIEISKATSQMFVKSSEVDNTQIFLDGLTYYAG